MPCCKNDLNPVLYLETNFKVSTIKFRKKLSEVYDTDTLDVKVWPLNFYNEH